MRAELAIPHADAVLSSEISRNIASLVTGHGEGGDADAVVIQEDTVADGNAITVTEAAITGRHIRPAGVDFREGDVLLSGTPANSRPVQPGDVVEVEVDGLGVLRNHIVSGPIKIRADVGAQPTESEEVRSTALGGDWEFRGIRPPRR